MEQTVCDYCLGCNRLENNFFKKLKHCPNFVPANTNWHEEYIKKIKGERKQEIYNTGSTSFKEK